MKVFTLVLTFIAALFTVLNVYGLFELTQIYNDPIKLASWSAAQLGNAVRTSGFMIVVGMFMTFFSWQWYNSE